MIALLTQALPWVALGDIWEGHWPSASASLAEGLELAHGTRQHQITAHLIAIQALLAAVRGEEERCRALAAESLELASARRLVHVSICATWALAVLELGLGRPEAALTHARALPDDGGHRLGRAGPHRGGGARRRDRDRRRRGSRPSSRGRSAAARRGGKRWPCTAARCCARTPTRPSACSRPRSRCTSAPRARSSAPAPSSPSASSCAACAAAPEARTHLRAALERFEALGGALWAERARGELRASGETARKRDPSTLDDLTAQEVHIAQLVAEGRTNRDVAGSSSSARARSTSTCATSIASSASRRGWSWRAST